MPNRQRSEIFVKRRTGGDVLKSALFVQFGGIGTSERANAPAMRVTAGRGTWLEGTVARRRREPDC
jgi:hypothetical protein